MFKKIQAKIKYYTISYHLSPLWVVSPVSSTNVITCLPATEARKWPIRCEELPIDIPALPHMQAVRTTHTEPDSRTRDAQLIPEQAGFRPGKSCTSQLLNLTEHIKDGHEKRLITDAVFVDLSASYGTVNHRRLLSKVLQMTGDVHLTDLIRTMQDIRRFFVVLNG